MSPQRWLALAREALLLEFALYRSLARWVTRRPDVPAGALPLGYAQLVGPMLWLWIFGSATEVVVVEVVLRNIESRWAETLRLPLLVVGIWGVLWMLGMLAAYRVRPHLLFEDHLRIRSGARAWVSVPLDAVMGVRAVEHELPGLIKSMHQDDGLLLVGISSRTNLEITLTGPTRLGTYQGPVTAETVGLWVDETRTVADLIKTRSSAHLGPLPGDHR